mmetsp:Transcript_67810/g.145163  ORF Transcript_67810/g.145163 Transcript_67810/m.145163 type:complete len:206 (-) Transcript_67810:889-1506(-)
MTHLRKLYPVVKKGLRVAEELSPSHGLQHATRTKELDKVQNSRTSASSLARAVAGVKAMGEHVPTLQLCVASRSWEAEVWHPLVGVYVPKAKVLLEKKRELWPIPGLAQNAPHVIQGGAGHRIGPLLELMLWAHAFPTDCSVHSVVIETTWQGVVVLAQDREKCLVTQREVGIVVAAHFHRRGMPVVPHADDLVPYRSAEDALAA